MNRKLSQCIEMITVFIIISIIAGLRNILVSLSSSIPVRMIIMIFIYIAMTSIPVMLYRIKKIPLSQFGFRRDRLSKQIMIALPVFAVTILLFVILPLLVGASKSDVLSTGTSRVYAIIFNTIYDLILVGFGEEIIFRGYFYNGIRNLTNSELQAVIISSIIFGLWHYPGGHDIMQVAATSVIGLIYGFSRYRIKNCTVLSTSIAHGMHDAVIFLLSCIMR